MDEGVEQVELGLYVVRGDNIVRFHDHSRNMFSLLLTTTAAASYHQHSLPYLPYRLPLLTSPFTLHPHPQQTLIGELDPEADAQVDLSTIRAEPIREIVH